MKSAGAIPVGAIAAVPPPDLQRRVDAGAAPELRFAAAGDDAFRLTDIEHGVELLVSRLRYDRHELHGELAVSCSLPGARVIEDGVLSVGSFNLSSTRARTDRAKHLQERARTNGKIDWNNYLEELCHRTLTAIRKGAAAVDLRTVPRPPAERFLDVNGIRLYYEHPVFLFGDGGAFKSYFALYTAAEVARRNKVVLYADWELSPVDHRERLERMYGDQSPCVLYVRCDRPLVHEIDRLVRLREQHGVDFMVFDSVVFACDGPPEAAEVALRYFQSLRQLKVGSLHIAHTNRSATPEDKPFGSAFWHNGARGTWFTKRIEDAAKSEDAILVGLFNKKSNLGRLMPPAGFLIRFQSEHTAITRADLSNEPDFASRLSIRQRMVQLLASEGRLTLVELANRLDANVDTVNREVRRYKTQFTRVTSGTPDGIHRIALTSSRSEP